MHELTNRRQAHAKEPDPPRARNLPSDAKMTTIALITNQNGIATVNARELHAFLEVKTHFRNWIRRRIETYGFVEGEDFTTSAFENDGNDRSIFEVDKFVQLTSTEETGKNANGIFAPPKFGHRVTLLTHDEERGSDGFDVAVDYHLTVDMAKELSMLENNVKGKEARRYFIKREADAARLQIENSVLAQKLVKSLESNNQKLLTSNGTLLDTNTRLEEANGDLELTNKVLVNAVKDYQASPQQLKERIDQGIRVKEQQYRRSMSKESAKILRAVAKIDAYLRKHMPAAHQDLEGYLNVVKSSYTCH